MQTKEDAPSVARRRLEEYLKANDTNALALSKQCGVGQTVIWRFLSGETQKITTKVGLVLRYAEIEFEESIKLRKQPDPMDNPRLRQVVMEACRGRPEAAALLVKVIEAMSPVIQEISIQQRSEAQ